MEKVNYWLGMFLALLMGIMTVDVLWGVFTRYIVGNQASWTEELARFLLIWIGMLGAAFAAGLQMHLAIDLLPQRLAGPSKSRLLVIIDIIVILFVLAVMVIGGSRYVYLSLKLGQISPAMQIPMGYIYLVMPISGLLIIWYKFVHMQRRLARTASQEA